MKARIAPIFRRVASPSALQSSAAICQVSTSPGSRPAAAAPAATAASVCAMLSAARPKLTNTPSAAAAAPASALGPEAARNTGTGRFTQGGCTSAPCHDLGAAGEQFADEAGYTSASAPTREQAV